MLQNVYHFAPKHARPQTDLKALFDYRSGVRVLACDETFDVVEPHASELEALMMERRHGFTHAWRLADLSPGLLGELRRVGVPLYVVNGVVILPADFCVVNELPPDEGSAAMTATAWPEAA